VDEVAGEVLRGSVALSGWLIVYAELVGLSDIEWLREKVTPAFGGVSSTVRVTVEVEARGTRAERATSPDVGKPSHQVFQRANESSASCGR